MSNLGVVQSSAATVIGLQSPEMVLIQIQMLKNANEQREDTFTIGAEVTDDKNAATIELGQQQALETRIKAEGSISGAVASTITLAGSTGISMSDQMKVDTMNKQLQNIGTFKENLGAATSVKDIVDAPLDTGVTLSPLKDIGNPPLDKGVTPSVPVTSNKELTFKEQFDQKTLDERAAMFNDQSAVDYFKDKATEFQGEAVKTARDDATALEEHLQRQVSILNTKIRETGELGRAFGQSMNGLVSGAFEMGAADAQLQQSQQQVLQNMADNSKSFVETMQSTMDQMVQMSLKGVEELQQNLQSVVQASNSRA